MISPFMNMSGNILIKWMSGDIWIKWTSEDILIKFSNSSDIVVSKIEMVTHITQVYVTHKINAA